MNSLAVDLVIFSFMEIWLYSLNVLCRYRVAEVEWIQDIMPPEGTSERETVSSLKFCYECVCKLTVMLDRMLVYLTICMHMRFFWVYNGGNEACT